MTAMEKEINELKDTNQNLLKHLQSNTKAALEL